MSTKKLRPPAMSPQGRENQLIALAVDLAEKQLLDGSASAQVITHYLKLGSSREKLEKEKLKFENGFLKAKTEAVESNKKLTELYEDAMSAMKIYQ